MWVKYYLTTPLAIIAAVGALGVGAVVAFLVLNELPLIAQIVAFVGITVVDFCLLWFVLLGPQKKNGLAINTSTGEVEIGKVKSSFSSVKKLSTMKVSNSNGGNVVLIISTSDKEARVGLVGLNANQKETLKTALPRFRSAEVEGTTLEEILDFLK